MNEDSGPEAVRERVQQRRTKPFFLLKKREVYLKLNNRKIIYFSFVKLIAITYIYITLFKDDKKREPLF